LGFVRRVHSLWRDLSLMEAVRVYQSLVDVFDGTRLRLGVREEIFQATVDFATQLPGIE